MSSDLPADRAVVRLHLGQALNAGLHTDIRGSFDDLDETQFDLPFVDEQLAAKRQRAHGVQRRHAASRLGIFVDQIIERLGRRRKYGG